MSMINDNITIRIYCGSVAATDTKRAINSQNTLEGPESSAHKGIYAESNVILFLLVGKG